MVSERRKQRGNGEGSIYQRESDGKWVGAVSLPDGKRKVVYGKTRKEVADKLHGILKDVHDGRAVQANERETVGEYLARWLDTVAKPSVKPNTYDYYEQIIRCHLVPELGRARLTKLTPEVVQKLLNEKLASGLSPQTVKEIRDVLRNALNRALAWGLVSRNVAALAKPPKQSDYEIQPWTAAQVRAFLTASETHSLHGLFVTAAGTGCRQGELLALKWQDVDLEKRVMSIRGTLVRRKGEWRIDSPKSARGRRQVELTEIVVAALRRHRVQQNEQRLRAGDIWQDHGLVFASEIGTPLDGTNVRHRMQAIANRAGLPPKRFHDLRHATATFLLQAGVPPRTVMAIMGHSQISLTMRYQHVEQAIQREAIDRLDGILKGVV